MKKEYLFISAALLILLAYGIDFISGRIVLGVKNPYAFLTSPLTSKYPLTTLGIFTRSVGVSLLVWLSFSFISGFHFKKAIALLILFILTNLYSIQQLLTGVKITTDPWTISIAYSGALLLIPMIFYFIKGTTTTVVKKITPPKPPQIDQDPDIDSKESVE